MMTWQMKRIKFIVSKTLKYPFLRKGMGIDLPITISKKECGLAGVTPLTTPPDEVWKSSRDPGRNMHTKVSTRCIAEYPVGLPPISRRIKGHFERKF